MSDEVSEGGFDARFTSPVLGLNVISTVRANGRNDLPFNSTRTIALKSRRPNV
jgi:hypothetical protein